MSAPHTRPSLINLKRTEVTSAGGTYAANVNHGPQVNQSDVPKIQELATLALLVLMERPLDAALGRSPALSRIQKKPKDSISPSPSLPLNNGSGAIIFRLSVYAAVEPLRCISVVLIPDGRMQRCCH